jgi:MinD-like ATPase involved in chromosome partitioning or flagellar assembly
MGLLDKIKDKVKEKNLENQNIGRITSNAIDYIIQTISGIEHKRTKRVIDNVMVITNASGGAGASTIAANVAFVAYKRGFNVLLIDLNVMYPIQQILFGLKQEYSKPDLVSYLMGENSLGESIDSSKGISILCSNNRGISDSINCENDTFIGNFEKAIEAARQLFDLVIIDAPMKIDHLLVNNAFYLANAIYLVWDEGIGSIVNTEKIRKNMGYTGIDAYSKMKVILNKRTNISYNTYPFEQLDLELVQILPFAAEVIECGLRSVIFCDKGSTSTENGNMFYRGIENLVDIILKNGGYLGDGPKETVAASDTERSEN